MTRETVITIVLIVIKALRDQVTFWECKLMQHVVLPCNIKSQSNLQDTINTHQRILNNYYDFHQNIIMTKKNVYNRLVIIADDYQQSVVGGSNSISKR